MRYSVGGIGGTSGDLSVDIPPITFVSRGVLVSATLGHLDQATVHFEKSLPFCRKAGYNPELAWTCCDYADTLLQRSGDGDRAKAMALLDESLAISSELGMRPLMERAIPAGDTRS